MRATTVFRRLLGMASTVVSGFYFLHDGLFLSVRPTWRRRRCSGCKRPARSLGVLTENRQWRHLPWGSTRIYLVADVHRVRCKRCGDVAEFLPWSAEPRDRFSAPMSDLIASLAQDMPQVKVSKLLGIPWATVGSVARRVAERLLPGDRMDGLKRIAVDEFYWAKKEFITVVWDHDRSRVVWVGDGKSQDTLAAFFTELGIERCEAIEIVTGDMGAGYLNAVANHLPKAQYVLDHFHVLRLAHDAVDEVRRAAVRELRSADDAEEARAVKNSRYTLFTSASDLGKRGDSKIEDIRRSYHKLYRAWSMKEALAYALTYRSVPVATRELKRIIKWMKLSRLPPFIKLGKTLRGHLDKIINSIRYQISNGPLEGCNRKIRGLIYRAYGYRSRDNFVGAIYLNCSGVEVPNPLAPKLCTSL